jgi:copper(I)-binding protein
MKLTRIALLAVAVALVVSACSSSSDGLAVDDPWGRTSPAAASNGAFYMTLSGGGSDDVLVSAASDACGMVQLHVTTMSDGVMTMEHLPDGIPVPADSEVSLEPGGLHVMCMNKQVDLNVGDTIELDLVFESADPMTVDVEIRDE